VEVFQTQREVWGILPPRHVVDARCRLFLQVEELGSQQLQREMVHQVGEPERPILLSQ
jgi:hypothetical protein